jgi:hypothetical protein
MNETEELKQLKKKCLKKNGDPRKDATAEDLQRLMELQNKPPDPNDRIAVTKTDTHEIVSVAKGLPMSLEGLCQGEWKVIAVISSNGARGLKVPIGKYQEYRLAWEVRKHMEHKPPISSMKPTATEGSPKIME